MECCCRHGNWYVTSKWYFFQKGNIVPIKEIWKSKKLQKFAKIRIYLTRQVCTYWTNFWQPTAHRRQNIFGKIPIEVYSPHLYASFGTIYVQIDQLFAPQLVFKLSQEFQNRRHFPPKTANCRFSNILQRLTVPRMIYQFCRKIRQKKRKDVDYKLL